MMLGFCLNGKVNINANLIPWNILLRHELFSKLNIKICGFVAACDFCEILIREWWNKGEYFCSNVLYLFCHLCWSLMSLMHTPSGCSVSPCHCAGHWSQHNILIQKSAFPSQSALNATLTAHSMADSCIIETLQCLIYCQPWNYWQPSWKWTKLKHMQCILSFNIWHAL